MTRTRDPMARDLRTPKYRSRVVTPKRQRDPKHKEKIMLKTFDEKVDDAVYAAMTALGISPALCPDTADLLNDAISEIARNVVTDDEED